MSLLFSRVALYCERSKEKKIKLNKASFHRKTVSKLHDKTHSDAFTEEDAIEAVFKRIINRVPWMSLLAIKTFA